MMQLDTDEALIAKAQRGDEQALEGLLRRHYRLLYRIAYRWCGRREDAEDITQDAAVKLASQIHSYRGEARFSSWLYRIVIHAAMDHQKRQRRSELRHLAYQDCVILEEADAGPEQRLEAIEALNALAALPEKLREAAFLVFCEEFDHREAARVLKCAEATVAWRLFQARKHLKKALATASIRTERHDR